jgi:D-alanine-D-alanine ligase
MHKTNIAIIYGGRSVEHQISIRSARNIAENINRELFHPVLIGITMEGNWFLTDTVSREISEGLALKLNLNIEAKELIDASGISHAIDIAFPVLHGTDGEDGSVQGLLKVLNIPCVGSDVLGSAISMNKLVSKQLLKHAGIPVGNFIGIYKDRHYDVTKIITDLGIPLVVKPSSLGSSVGVGIAKRADQVESMIQDAFQYDYSIILEEYIQGREIECAIIGNENPQASLPGEIVVSEKYEFYSYDAKYVDPFAARLDIPAKMKPEIQKKIQQTCLEAYRTLNCCDYARVDLFLTKKGEIFINEINTIPGFTNSSMFPKMWEHMGIPYSEIITKLIELAMGRQKKGNELNRIYNSNLE